MTLFCMSNLYAYAGRLSYARKNPKSVKKIQARTSSPCRNILQSKRRGCHTNPRPPPDAKRDSWDSLYVQMETHPKYPAQLTPPCSLASAPLLALHATDTPIVRHCPGHEPLSRAFCLLLNVLPVNLVTLLSNEAHQRQSHQECAGQQNHVDGDGVVVEGEVSRSVET